MAAFFSSVLFAVTILCFFRAMLTAESISLQDLICIEYGRPFLNLCLHPGHTLPFSITSTIIKQKLVKVFCIFLVSPLRLKKSGVLNVIARWHSGTWQYCVVSRLTLFAFVVYLALYIIESHLFFTDFSSFLPTTMPSDSEPSSRDEIAEVMTALKNNDHKWVISTLILMLLTMLRIRASVLKPYINAGRWISPAINPFANLTSVFFTTMETDVEEEDVNQSSEM